MKLLLVTFFALFSGTLIAQITTEDVLKRLESLDGNHFKKQGNSNLLHTPKTFSIDNKKTEIFYNTEPTVYSLVQDGMPCIVPDSRAVVAIPNSFSNVVVPFKSAIPNAAPLKPLLLPNKKWSK